MSIVFQLGPTSATAVTLRPEYDFERDLVKIENRHRTKSGRLYTYLWATYPRFEFSVQYVSSASAALVNSWWSANTNLLFFITTSGATEVFSVQLTTKSRPLASFVEPGAQYYKGKILLEGY